MHYETTQCRNAFKIRIHVTLKHAHKKMLSPTDRNLKTTAACRCYIVWRHVLCTFYEKET
jgi:hypothetical protein